MLMTGNEFALAQLAVSLAISWHKDTPQCDYRDNEISKLSRLSTKLNKLLDDNGAIVAATDGDCEFEISDYQDLTAKG